MRVLLVKTSSLGDVIHTLPALTDAARAIPGIQFDWVVEEGFAEIPAWHPAVARVIPVAIRRWRKNLWQTLRNGEWRRFKQRLKEVDYDLVIDAQGLLKSAWLTRYVGKTPVAGLDRDSAREPLASRFYRRAYPVAWGSMRWSARASCSPRRWTTRCPSRSVTMAWTASSWPTPTLARRTWCSCTVLPGSPSIGRKPTGANWPSACASAAGRCACPAAPPSGSGRAPGGGLENAAVLPRLSLAGMAKVLAGARACVAVDTGLGHLAAALDADAVAVRSDQSWLHRRLRALPGPPGQRLPLCAVPEEDLYLPADRRGPQTVRSQA